MRSLLSVIFVVSIVGLITCAIISVKSKRRYSNPVAILLFGLLIPVLGNLFIIASDIRELSLAGCYIYFIGMNIAMFGVFNFGFEYCNFSKKYRFTKYIVAGFLVLDTIQLLINLKTGHAFILNEPVEVYGSNYYGFTPLVGQTIHRVIDYSILAFVLIVFVIKSIISPRVYAERFIVILIAMIAVSAWQTFYIFSRRPIDYSMIGFTVFGLLIFWLALYFRPLRLLDRMLAAIASRMPEALFFFDTNGRCIWLNDKAIEFLKLNPEKPNYMEEVPEKLETKIGKYREKDVEKSYSSMKGSGETVESYVIEQQSVKDIRNKCVGFYVSVHDNSVEEKKLQKESFKAKHDPLTKILNRAGYELTMEKIDLSTCFLLLIDLDSFKEVNDNYGHKIGDKILIKAVDTMCKYFKEDFVCRIGGDEFAIVSTNVDVNIVGEVKEKIKNINDELLQEGELPAISVSAGGAFGKDAENDYELFNNADHALYETKLAGKKGFTLFKKR